MCYFKFTFIAHILDFMSNYFNYPRRPYGMLVSKHPDGYKALMIAICEAKYSDADSAKVIEYAILEPEVARNFAKNIIMIADQVETFRS